MEHPCLPFLAAARLLFFANISIQCYSNGHHISDISVGARAHHGLHHEEIAWVRLRSDDAAATHRGDTTE